MNEPGVSQGFVDHLLLLAKQLPAVVWTTDTALILTAALGTGLARTHRPSQQVVDMEVWVFFQAHEADATVCCARYANITPLGDATGSLVGTIGIALDITEWQQQVWQQRQIVYVTQESVAQMVVSAQQHLETFVDLQQRNATLAYPQLVRGLDRLHQALVVSRPLVTHLLARRDI